MKHPSLLPILILALIFCLSTAVRSQSPTITHNSDGSVTVDASHLNTVVLLNAPWRFSAADRPEFADPGFDDSTWPLLTPAVEQHLSAAHLPDMLNGRCWTRLHLQVLNASSPLAITISTRDGTQYAVFANGKEIGRSKGYTSETKYLDRPIRLQLPASRDLVIAIHLIHPGRSRVAYFLLEDVQIGQTGAVSDRITLAHYVDFEANWLSYILLASTFLAGVPFSLVLLFAQRNHIEYLWFAIFCACGGAAYAMIAAISLLHLPYTPWILNTAIFFGALEMIAALEFAAALAEIRRRPALRFVQAIQLVSPTLFASGAYKAETFSDAIGSILWLGTVAYLLGSAYRRGSKECGLLAVPLIFLELSALLAQAEGQFPQFFGDQWQGHFGGIGVRSPDIGSLLVIVGVLAIVLYRFIRVSESEQLAAAELEAARSVQQLLIPAVQPATPGFTIESVYLPARQVGGDFFLILPAPDTAADPSLLAVIGDVSGKGLQAAMVVSTIVGGLRMQLSRRPAEVLAQLNRALTGNVSGFATCCAILLHPDGRAILANAGNPSPYCDGEELPTLPGLPLGLAPDVTYDEMAFILASGSRLSFVSDGVVEATSFPGKELFGFDRTQAISTQSAFAIAEAACAFGVGAPQADDITVLTITRE